MERRFSVTRTSRQTADIREPLVASVRDDPDGSIVRRLIMGKCVVNEGNADASLAVAIRHQRRSSRSGEWEEPDHYGPAQLQAGQELRMDFKTDETLALYSRLREWYLLCAGGLPREGAILSVVDENDVTILRGHEREILTRMLEGGDEFWALLEELQPDLLTAVAVNRLHAQRVAAVQQFQAHMDRRDWSEQDWQRFFERETWIFGHGLAYQFLDVVTGQPAYGGIGVDRRGLQLGDYLLATRAAARFTVLVEIKKPQTSLLGGPYRPGGDVYRVHNEVSGGVSQVQAACRTWITEGARADANRQLLDEGIETYEPRGVLLVGDTAQLGTPATRRSFELFRRNLMRPEIITFDELLARARYMVEIDQPGDRRGATAADDDIPDDAWDDDF